MDYTNTQEPSGLRISPLERRTRNCLWCDSVAEMKEWSIPGLWTLGLFECSQCGRSFWSDLEYGLGALGPVQIDAATGDGQRFNGSSWYLETTQRAYRERINQPVRVTVEGDKNIRTGLLVNCLSPWWGDTISLILRTNLLLNLGIPIIVLTTRDAAWLMPKHVSQVWVVEQTVSSTVTWNEALSEAVKKLVAGFDDIKVPAIFQPAVLSHEEVAAVTKVQPFDRSRWMENEATFGFAWRSDRCWVPSQQLMPRLPGRLRRLFEVQPGVRQASQVVQCFEQVKRCVPSAKFVCFGLAEKPEPLPNWIEDQRTTTVGALENRQWCQAAAKCHVLAGVLGSHMTLPSFHAGSIVDLVPQDMARLVLTDIGVVSNDVREAIFLYRLIPSSTTPLDLASIMVTIYANTPVAQIALGSRHYRSFTQDEVIELENLKEKRHCFPKEKISKDADGWITP